MTESNKQAPASAGALPMSAAEFRCLRDWLGLTAQWLADHLEVSPRSVQRWDDGSSPVPAGVADELLRLSEVTYDVLDGLVEKLLDATDPGVITYRSDADYHRHHPEVDWPASWHRALCARLADEVPGLRIEFWGRP